MKQILQNLKTGETELTEIPTPQIKPGHLLIRTQVSVVSAGTERMLVEFGKANFIQKARQQPDKVKQVLNKIKTDGLKPTITAVRTKLDQPLPLGYSNAGIVIAIGKDVEGYSIGDRVVSNGYHAEIVSVPKNLCAKIPDGVDNESAAFTIIGAVGLQGIRLAKPTLGEYFVVTGLGLIGLITTQLLIAHGCRVMAIDFDQKKLELAKQFGADIVDLSTGIDPVSYAHKMTKGRGVDGVIITASTKSSEPVHQAAQMCRKRGRIVLVGVTGLELARSDFYEKELSFQVSCSYGPGRYDSQYEQMGQDYPLGFVRWTEQRNFEAILDMLANQKLSFYQLITHSFQNTKAIDAYNVLRENKSAIGIVLNYPQINDEIDTHRTIDLRIENNTAAPKVQMKELNIGFIGAGNFSNQVLIPALKKTDANLKNIASSGGVTGVHVGKRFGFEKTTTDVKDLISDSEVGTIFVTTRHDTHFKYVREALLAGKHVFVEKPLCLNKDELEFFENQLLDDQILMVGFNRRFAPHIVQMKKLMNMVSEPKTMVMVVNSGNIPSSHWTQDPEIGGGRIIGEACHFIDLLRFLTDSAIIGVSAMMLGESPGVEVREDKITITLAFADGSIGTIHYFSNGHKSYPKERLEVFAGGKVLSLDNFKVLKGYGWSNFNKMKLWNQDKGHDAEVRAFIEAIKSGGTAPIPLHEIIEVMKATFAAIESAKDRGSMRELNV
jgi:predicted dehydrogenase/threonine dehydrogenase-like Zn-dependent dehydrogenase